MIPEGDKHVSCILDDVADVNVISEAFVQKVGLQKRTAAGVKASGRKLVAHMLHDKKMEGGRLPFLLARGIGQTFLDKNVDLAVVEAFLDGERG